jgi:hypothetical protein
MAMKTILLLVVELMLTTMTDASPGKLTTLFLERNTIEVGREAVVHVMLPPRTADVTNYTVYWTRLPNGVAQGALAEKPIHLVYREKELDSGRSTISVILCDNEGAVEKVETATIVVTTSRIGDKIASGISTFFSTFLGAVLAIAAYVLQKTYSARHERRRCRKEYHGTICAVIDHIVVQIKKGKKPVEVPERVANPGTSQWSEVMIEPRYQRAIIELEDVCQQHNIHGYDPDSIEVLKRIKESLAEG